MQHSRTCEIHFICVGPCLSIAASLLASLKSLDGLNSAYHLQTLMLAPHIPRSSLFAIRNGQPNNITKKTIDTNMYLSYKRSDGSAINYDLTDWKREGK